MSGENTTTKLDSGGSDPLYRQLYDRIKGLITDGAYAPGSALPSIKKLASEYGVSIITVESALHKLIDEGLCYRRPKKGTFVTASAADGARGRDGRRTIVLHAPGVIESSNVLNLLNHFIHNEARVRQIDVLHTFGNIEEEVRRLANDPGICLLGVVMMQPDSLAVSSRMALKHPEVRIVNLNYQFENFDTTPANLYGVFSDEVGGGYAITSYLLQRGARDIGVVSCDNRDINYAMRVQGYAMALEHFSVPYDPEKITVVVNPEPENAVRVLRKMGEDGIRRLMDKMDPDAVLFLNDTMAAGACEYLRREHPDSRIKVAGYDNYIPELSLSYNFPTVEVDLRRMGTLTVRLLAAETLPRVKCFRCPPTLIPR